MDWVSSNPVVGHVSSNCVVGCVLSRLPSVPQDDILLSQDQFLTPQKFGEDFAPQVKCQGIS
jgi:hypothetical protein